MFWAGPKEHGIPGRHEYERDLTELAWQLEHATNLHGVKTVVKVVTKPPRDISELDDADALVVFGNGAWLKTETGILFPQDQDTDGRTYDAEHTDWLNKLDAVIKRRKMGLAIFHYTMWVDNWVGKRFLMDWFGGNWLPYSSHNPVDTWTVSPLPVRHPILNGVQPWTYRDEMFSRYFLYHDPQAHRVAAGHARHRQQWRARSGVLGLQPSRWRPFVRVGRLGLPRQHAQCGGVPEIPAERHRLDRRPRSAGRGDRCTGAACRRSAYSSRPSPDAAGLGPDRPGGRSHPRHKRHWQPIQFGNVRFAPKRSFDRGT